MQGRGGGGEGRGERGEGSRLLRCIATPMTQVTSHVPTRNIPLPFCQYPTSHDNHITFPTRNCPVYPPAYAPSTPCHEPLAGHSLPWSATACPAPSAGGGVTAACLPRHTPSGCSECLEGTNSLHHTHSTSYNEMGLQWSRV